MRREGRMGILDRFRRGNGKEIPEKPREHVVQEAETHFRLGSALLSQEGKLDDAIKEYKEGLRINPNHAEAHYKLGLAFMAQGRLDESLKEYKECLVVDPNHADAHNKLGLVYNIQSRLDGAVEEFQATLRINPNHANAHYNLGQAYLSQGKLDEAIKEYKEAIRIDPNNAKAISNLAATSHLQREQSGSGRIRWMALDYKRFCPNCGAALDLSFDIPLVEDEHGCYATLFDPQSNQESRKKLPNAVMRTYDKGGSESYTIENVCNAVGGELVQLSNEKGSDLQMLFHCQGCGGVVLRGILATATILNEEERMALVREKQQPQVWTLPIVFLVCSGYMSFEDMKFLSPTSGEP
jgi:tetratricopeptide (TPR) repeat protein